MPGRGSYGPGGRWIHDRAHRIMEESEGIPKSMAYAIATQQAHKVGKSPKRFRTAEGVQTAKAKMSRSIAEYRKTAGVIKEARKKKGVSPPIKLQRKTKAERKLSRQQAKAFKSSDWTARAREMPKPPLPEQKIPNWKKKGMPKPPVEQIPTPAVGDAPTKQISRLRRYGIPAAVGAATLGGIAYAVHRRKKRREAPNLLKSASIVGFFDELEKMAQMPSSPPPPPVPGMGSQTSGALGAQATGTMGAPGSMAQGSGVGAQPPSVQAKPRPIDGISGAGIGKIGGVGSDLAIKGATGLATKVVEHPGLAYWRYHQQKEGLSKHKQTMLALKYGYPAGWVSLGMRPK